MAHKGRARRCTYNEKQVERLAVPLEADVDHPAVVKVQQAVLGLDGRSLVARGQSHESVRDRLQSRRTRTTLAHLRVNVADVALERGQGTCVRACDEAELHMLRNESTQARECSGPALASAWRTRPHLEQLRMGKRQRGRRELQLCNRRLQDIHASDSLQVPDRSPILVSLRQLRWLNGCAPSAVPRRGPAAWS